MLSESLGNLFLWSDTLVDNQSQTFDLFSFCGLRLFVFDLSREVLFSPPDCENPKSHLGFLFVLMRCVYIKPVIS